MPARARVDEFIAMVESGDHAGAIERYYTEDASMQENAAAPRVGRDFLRGVGAVNAERRISRSFKRHSSRFRGWSRWTWLTSNRSPSFVTRFRFSAINRSRTGSDNVAADSGQRS